MRYLRLWLLAFLFLAACSSGDEGRVLPTLVRLPTLTPTEANTETPLSLPTATPEPSETPVPTATATITDTPTSLPPNGSTAQIEFQASDETAIVTNIVDGDTIDVRFPDGHVDRIRYIGMDTPERGERCFSEATAANSALVAGQEVQLVKDVRERGPFNRLLRYVYVGDTFVNAELVTQGYAVAAEFPPDTAFAETFASLETQARQQRTGCLFGAAVVEQADVIESRPETWYVSVDADGRACPRTSCESITTFQAGAAITVNGVVDSDNVGGSSLWLRVVFGNSVVWVHNALALREPVTIIQPASTPSQFTCNCSRTCPQMLSCEEAYFQLLQCGCGRRDGDGDGVPCEGTCPGG